MQFMHIFHPHTSKHTCANIGTQINTHTRARASCTIAQAKKYKTPILQKPPIPWKSVWTSMPVWAIIVAHTCSNWGWYMLLVKLPTYMRYILKFDIKAVS